MSKILVVDDEERMARFIHLNLEHDGFQVVEVYRGMKAIESLRVDLPDLILLDVMLPDIDGYEVLRRLRAARINTPVLILSGLAEPDKKIKGLGFGADD